MLNTRYFTINLLILSLFALTISVSSAQDATPEATASPTGEIAFSSLRDGNQSEAIFVMNTDGSNVRAISNPDHHSTADFEPVWSPDGTQIAFASNRDAKPGDINNLDIYVMNADGSNPRNLTNNPAYDNDPAWSPDGKQIAFASSQDGFLTIYVMNADGSNPQRLAASSGAAQTPQWSPDAKQIVFVSGFDLYVMNANGTNLRNLTNSPDSDDVNPAWSPDGTQIAFASNRDNGYYTLYVMNADGSNPNQIIDAGYGIYNDLPTWSPDGKQIAFVSERDGRDTPQIYVMNADGSDEHIVSQNEPGQFIVDTDPTWRPEPKS